MASGPQVTPLPDGRTGVVTWSGSRGTGEPDPSTDVAALSRAVRAGFADGLQRVEARVAPDDRGTRRALHRLGFRLEGRLRAAGTSPDGTGVDVLLYARLLDDPTDGREAFTAVMNTVTPRKRLIAHALVTDTEGRVLLCETSFKPDWELPGGIVEPGESPRTACAREITEELGISLEPGRLLVVDWLHPHLGWEDALEVVMATEPLTPAQVAAITPDGVEILAAHWLALDEACERVAPYAAGRLRQAWQANRTGGTHYLEDGRPPLP